MARVLTSVSGNNGNGYAFRNTDVPSDRLGRLQIHRVRHAVGCGGRLRSNGRPASMQYLCEIGVNVCRSIGLEGGDQGRKTAFRGATERKSGGRLSRSTRQGEPITWRPVANDTASFPLNRSAAAVTTTKDLAIAPGLRFFWSAPSGVAGHIPRP